MWKQDDSQKPARREEFRGTPLSLREAMNQLFDESFWAPFGEGELANFEGVYPEVDVSEDENNVTVKANLPGVNKDDVNLEVNDNIITLSGKTEKEDKQEDEKVYRYERSYGEFRRDIRLPAKVKTEEAKANMKDGVLTIELPKEEQGKSSNQIEIEEG